MALSRSEDVIWLTVRLLTTTLSTSRRSAETRFAAASSEPWKETQ